MPSQQKCNSNIYKHITMGKTGIVITVVKVRMKSRWLSGKRLRRSEKSLMINHKGNTENSPD